MSTGLRELLDEDLDVALEQLLLPRLTAVLRQRGLGHCMRITDVEIPLATRLTRRLRSALGAAARVHVLGGSGSVPPDVATTSTKVVELRNPDAAGLLRPPLLVFVPPGTHASAEDSFGVATFEQFELGDVYADLAQRLRESLPNDVRPGVDEVLSAATADSDWPYADAVAEARYLLTITMNDTDPTVAGAALFELGLIPDFELFGDPGQIPIKIARNLQHAKQLAATTRPVRHRVLELRLTDPEFRARLAAFLVDSGAEHPRTWVRRIVIDRDRWSLSFHRWPLQQQADEEVRIEVDELDLPRVGDDPAHAAHTILRNLAGQLLLCAGPGGLTQLTVSFRVAPDPRRIAGLAHFSVQLISEELGATGVAVSAKVSTTARTAYKATLKRLRNAELEPGWHFVRILPCDIGGVPLPVRHIDAEARPGNESDRFFVTTDAEIEEPERQPAEPDVGVGQAATRLAFQAIAEDRNGSAVQCRAVAWRAGAPGHRHVLEADFGRHGTVEITLSPVLTDLQRNLLTHPELLHRHRLIIQGDRVETSGPDALPWPSGASDATATFLAARRRLADAIADGSSSRVLEGCDLSSLRDLARAYAESYQDLLAMQLRQAERADEDRLPALLRELVGLLQVDTVAVEYVDYRDGPRTAVLVSPTHPLRLLWLVTWAELGRSWVDHVSAPEKAALADRSERAVVSDAWESLRSEVTPTGFPLVVPQDDGRLTMAVSDLSPYWGLCLPSETEDPRGFITALALVLGMPDRLSGAEAVSGERLADRVERYLRLHPYVRVLTVNAVNPGRAEHLADMLVDLQRRKGCKDISYDIKLYSPEPTPAGIGAALAALLHGSWDSVAEAEAFHTPVARGLVPKLAVAVRPLAELRAADGAASAHITFLFDVFGGERFDTVSAVDEAPAPIHGLRQGMAVRYIESDGMIAWQRTPRHGPALPLPGADESPDVLALTDLLSALPTVISSASAVASTGQSGAGQVPQATLALDVAGRALLHQAHSCSDWVITADRTIGAEYFDPPGRSRRTEYLIDDDSEGRGHFGPHLLISSRSVMELRALLAPAAEQIGLEVHPNHLATLFEQLRLLSGRIALKLGSAAPSERAEVFGLALARLFLDYQGVLTNQILVPLDAHVELYREARRRVDRVGESAGLQRADLALFTLDARQSLLTCRLIEVKSRSQLTDLTAYQQLKDQMAVQLVRSESVLRANFDPHLTRPDRPDRVVRNAALADLLRPYLDRAIRHGTIERAPAREASWLLDHLDSGSYRLEFTRTGLIFDWSASGTFVEIDSGIEFHRIGRDLAWELIEAIPTEFGSPGSPSDHGEHTASSITELDLSLPRPAFAAFRAPARDHGIPDRARLEDSPDLDAAPPPSTVNEGEPALPSEPGVSKRDGSASEVQAKTEPPTRDGSSTHQPSAVPRLTKTDPERAATTTILERPTAGAAEVGPGATLPIIVGASSPSPQYGILGQAVDRKIALDLNETHTISLFGVQGGGKSYTLGSIMEMASLAVPPINRLPNPLATIVFHYSPVQDYTPEFTSMISPNDDSAQVQVLRDDYGADPAGLPGVILLAPEAQCAARREEYPGIQVLPLRFGSGELRAEHWRFLMGAVGNQSTYIRQLQRIMRANRNNLRLDVIRAGIDSSSLPGHIKQLAHQRLDLAAEYINDRMCIKDLVKPGQLIIVDLRDEFIEKDEALGLFVVLMQLFAEAQNHDERFSKLVVFDEAHKYIDSPDLVAGLVESVREMRHKGMSVLVASQDPPSVPISLIELSDAVILHKFTSPAWLRHLQKANAALADLTPAKLANLAPGEAYLWASRATDAAFTKGTVKIYGRPRLTRHGGGTRMAVRGSSDTDFQE